MKYLVCLSCGAPFMGTHIEYRKPMCQVCSSEDLVEVDLENMHEMEPLEIPDE